MLHCGLLHTCRTHVEQNSFNNTVLNSLCHRGMTNAQHNVTMLQEEQRREQAASNKPSQRC
jgi:hypothetical protein